MRTLLFGKDGQLGREFIPHLNVFSEVLAVGRNECDLSCEENIQALIEQFRPDLIINASAYTAVDQAEKDADTALQINALAPTAMAKSAQRLNSAMVHYSTDYVFDGLKQGAYEELDSCNPLSVYGSTKLKGEHGVSANCVRHLIFRTSWVFSAHGSNFLKTVLKLAATKEDLRVIDDQWGAPTSTELIVRVSLQALGMNAVIKNKEPPGDQTIQPMPQWGIFNLVAGGETNWHAYAQYVVSLAQELGMGDKFLLDATKINPIPSKDYPQLAPRPLNSRLSTKKIRKAFNLNISDWREGVQAELQKIKIQG
jgi:dTDP-4-dehydrorhamnose reductase